MKIVNTPYIEENLLASDEALSALREKLESPVPMILHYSDSQTSYESVCGIDRDVTPDVALTWRKDSTTCFQCQQIIKQMESPS